MLDENTRLIVVEKEFYVKLAEYLQPEERFISSQYNFGLVLYSPYIRRALVFLPKEAKEVK